MQFIEETFHSLTQISGCTRNTIDTLMNFPHVFRARSKISTLKIPLRGISKFFMIFDSGKRSESDTLLSHRRRISLRLQKLIDFIGEFMAFCPHTFRYKNSPFSFSLFISALGYRPTPE